MGVTVIPTVTDYFEEYVREAKKHEADLAGVNGIMQFDFRPSDDGVIVIRIENGKILPIERTYTEEATMTIRTAYPDFYKVKNGQEKFWKLMLFRKVKISGDKSFTKKLAAAGIH